MTFVMKVPIHKEMYLKESDFKISLLKHMFGGNSEVCYHPLIGRPYYISTQTAVEWSQRESNDRTFVKLCKYMF